MERVGFRAQAKISLGFSDVRVRTIDMGFSCDMGYQIRVRAQTSISIGLNDVRVRIKYTDRMSKHFVLDENKQ